MVSSASEPSGQTTTFTTYDAEGRLKQKTDGVGTTTYTYWPNGLLKEVTENGRTTYRGYDAFNRLNEYRDGEGNSIAYSYYPNDQLKTITYPGGRVVTYTYDDFGRLWKVTDWANRVTTYTYDNADRLTRVDRPNGTYRAQEYDAAGQLKVIRERKSDGTYLAYEELGYDDDGRITKQFLHPRLGSVTIPQDTLLYDDDNRLSTWNGNSVTFDHDGNMTSGPLPSGSIGTYVYDTRNRLTSAGGSSYRYNPDGLRVQITGAGAATFVVDPNASLSRVLMRTKAGATTYYVYGLGLLYEEDGGSVKQYHFDHLGNTVAMTDDSQNVTDKWAYTPFGCVAARSGSTDTPFQFNGSVGVETEGSGLLYMRARYYSPRLARFVNADPIKFDGGDNWYVFGDNNPIMRSDPSGLNPYAGLAQPVQPPGSYTYTGPTTVGAYGRQTITDLGHAGREFGAAVKDIATFGGSPEKVQVFSAIMTPVKVGGLLAGGSGSVTSLGLAARATTPIKAIGHYASSVLNAMPIGLTAAEMAHPDHEGSLKYAGLPGGIGVITGHEVVGAAGDVAVSVLTPPKAGGPIAAATYLVLLMEYLASQSDSGGGSCGK